MTTTYSEECYDHLTFSSMSCYIYNNVTIIVMVIVTSIVLEVFQLSIFELEFPQDSDTGIVFFAVLTH